ncbi:hypothetical protein Sme01_16100 [Sphaerisporangium melleum]|uniref:Uncharacterized protein n=1 Tax=Sphaerisporangium melleum TaxID=321316 RepID=A0A917RK93_9ACTN|nr:hypothetical protein [Sphaerisporangium melleum]GGL10577.1 hypothetical protein GCM10007964_60940 [Sphaerisporangium melleum]GII69134.1 hypothetical protein Sme01_16100 [Sphaerisporangium melleum]
MAGADGSAKGAPGMVTDVVPVHLKRRRDDFHLQSEELDTALRAAVGVLEGLGPFWGDDEHGRLFYEGGGGRVGFRQATEEIARHVGAVTTAYERIGDNVSQAGANLETADWASVAALAQAVTTAGLAVPTTKAEVR